MKGLLIVGVVLLATSTIVAGADKVVTVGDITAKVLGKSGKIKLYTLNESDPNTIIINFDSIIEVDSDGNAMTGSHSYQNFAQLDFTFSDPTNSTFANSTVGVTEFSFTATIEPETGKIATLVTDVYLFTEDGNITVNGDEVIEVKAGDLKFNIHISNWPFCGQGTTCTKGSTTITGDYLDFGIEMKGSGTATKKDKGAGTGSSPDEYTLGSGAKVIVPKKVIYDGGAAVDMPTDYPKLETKGSKMLFVFRFEKFETDVLYDPIASTGSADNQEPDDAEITQSGIVVKILGKSGKIQIRPIGTSPSDTDIRKVTVEFQDLVETTANGENIGDHSIKGFSNQEFTFSDVISEQYQGIDVERVTFTSTLSNGATLTVNLYVFKQDGSVTNGDETIDVYIGNVKFNVEVTNWDFCSVSQTCTEKGETVEGNSLDFTIVIKGSGSASKKGDGEAKKGIKFDLGEGSLVLSEQVKKDGTYELMAEGYPKKEVKGSKEMFHFRFPKFTTGIMYDPLIGLYSAGPQLRVSMAAMISLLLLCWKLF